MGSTVHVWKLGFGEREEAFQESRPVDASTALDDDNESGQISGGVDLVSDYQ